MLAKAVGFFSGHDLINILNLNVEKPCLCEQINLFKKKNK